MARRKGGSLVLTPKERELLERLFNDPRPLEYRSAAAMAKLMRGRMTAPGAKIACDNLVAGQILEMDLRKARRQGKTTRHFRLRTDLDGFRVLVQRYCWSLGQELGNYWPDIALRNLSPSRHARQFVNENLVRKLFAERGLRMAHEFRPAAVAKTAPDVAGNPRPTAHHWLPIVASPEARAEAIQRQVESSGGTPESRAELRAILESQWETSELQNLVWPVLALLEISPTVLLDFLGEWEPAGKDDPVNTGAVVPEIEHLLYQWIFFALSDIARSRDVPDGLDVVMAEVRPSVSWGAESRGGLLALHWRYKWILHYDSGFDTDHLMYGDGEDMFEVEINKANAWVRMSCEPIDKVGARAGKPILREPEHRGADNPKHVFKVLVGDHAADEE